MNPLKLLVKLLAWLDLVTPPEVVKTPATTNFEQRVANGYKPDPRTCAKDAQAKLK